LELNSRLRKELEAAKRKLAESENLLHEDINSHYQTGEDPFELVLTKNEAEEFIGSASKAQ
jgi:hypothetical protein